AVSLLHGESKKPGVADVLGAGSLDEAIDTAKAAVSSSTALAVPANFNPDAAMNWLEEQRQRDESALRFFGKEPPRAPNASTRVTPADVKVTVGDPITAFSDRVLSVREQLAEPNVRERIRAELGDDALSYVSYYSTVADNPQVDLPEATRERMIGVAEGILERALFKRENRPGLDGQAPATPGMLTGSAIPRIGLDTSPTGRFRADAAGNVAPETRADDISTQQGQRSAQEARNTRRAATDALGKQTPRGFNPNDAIRLPGPLPTGEATELPYIPTGDATEVSTLPTGEASELIPAGDAYEQPARKIPVGKAAELDVETIQPGDLMAKDGEPFVSKTGAQARAFASGGGKVVAIPNHFGSGQPGFVVRPLVQARPNNTRGTNAGDVARTAGQRADERGRGDGTAGVPDQRPSDVLPSPGATAGQGVAGPGTAGGGSTEPAALTGAAPELVKVRTVFGTNAYVRSSDLAGDDNGLVRMFTADGKNNGRIARGNLDQTGEKRAAAAKENADNPMFNVITRKGGGTFADQASAARELSMRGMGETHEVVPASEISPSATGYAIRKKPESAAPTFTEGQQVQLNGTPYTVTSANNTAVKLQGADGGIKMVARNSKTFGQIQADAAPAPAEAPRSMMKSGFDPDAWQKERDDRIKASREAGNTHLDKLPAYVETMRGKDVYGVHDTKVRGRVLTVDNNGNVYVEWLDAYSQEKEMAVPMKYGKKTVMQTSLGPRDLKDYVVGKPTQEPNEAARPQ
nr:hypothetical protein [Burkholderiaceae bacterium]